MTTFIPFLTLFHSVVLLQIIAQHLTFAPKTWILFTFQNSYHSNRHGLLAYVKAIKYCSQKLYRVEVGILGSQTSHSQLMRMMVLALLFTGLFHTAARVRKNDLLRCNKTFLMSDLQCLLSKKILPGHARTNISPKLDRPLPWCFTVSMAVTLQEWSFRASRLWLDGLPSSVPSGLLWS